jgi:hypothetical protein
MSISQQAYTRIPDYKDSFVEIKFSTLMRRLRARHYRYEVTIDFFGVTTKLIGPDGNPTNLEAAMAAVALLDQQEGAARRIRTAVSRLNAEANLERIRAKLNDPDWVAPTLEAVEAMTAEEINAAPEVKAAFDNKTIWGNFLGPRPQRA